MPSPSSPSSPRRRTKRLKRVPTFGDKNYLIGVGFGLFALAVFGAIYLVSYKLQFLCMLLMNVCEGTL